MTENTILEYSICGMNDETVRKIIHIDMDAFYASVEQRNNPSLQGKPVIVGGPPDSRSVVSTCSYEARVYGIHSAMPTSEAYRRCPHGVFITHSNFDEYIYISKQINSIFKEVTDLVEPLSLDEAFLDVTTNKLKERSATQVAEWIRQRIKNVTKLTASAGVSYNKSLAKIASDWKKPDGLTVIIPTQAMEFLKTLPVKKFFGIGPVTAAKMAKMGIHTGGDLRKWPMWQLSEVFGEAGPWYYNVCRGIDNRSVTVEYERKSLGKERTFDQNKTNIDEMILFLTHLSASVWQELKERKLMGKTLTVKVKYSNFKQVTRSHTCANGIQSLNQTQNLATDLLKATRAGSQPVRLLGLSFSSLFPEEIQCERQLEFEF